MKLWLELLETAIHTPSPHNVQPWRLKIVDDNQAELFIDSTRTLPKEDVTGSFIISTMGMFIESLDILARNRRFRVEYELLSDTDSIAPAILESSVSRLIPFARLHLVSNDATEDSFDERLFFKRRTSRLGLLDKEVPVGCLNALIKLAGEWRQSFAVTTDSDQIERILAINTEALFRDLNSEDYHDEIVEWFRYTRKQSLKHLDGLDARCMNTSPINYWMVANVPRLLLLPVAKQIMAKVYRSQLGKIPTLGIITGGFWEPRDGINAGRFLMRFWLETARQNIYIHPYGNLVTNRWAASEIETELGIKNIWLIFKMGYSVEPPKSYRLPVDRILV